MDFVCENSQNGMSDRTCAVIYQRKELKIAEEFTGLFRRISNSTNNVHPPRKVVPPLKERFRRAAQINHILYENNV